MDLTENRTSTRKIAAKIGIVNDHHDFTQDFLKQFSSKLSEVAYLSTLLHVESIHHLEADVLQASLLCQATSSLSLSDKWGKNR